MKITVAIPTIAGRLHYLASCLRTCVSQEYDDLEILVSDNSEGDARDLVDSFQDPRIRYVRPSTFLPMSMHWDFLVANLSGDYVTIIGDDDGLMPNAITRVSELLSALGKVCLAQSLCCYYWDDYPLSSERNSIVWFHSVSGELFRVKAADFLWRVCRGQADYTNGPMVYHGFIPVDLIRRMSTNKVFFHRSSPDIYSSLAIAANIDHFYVAQEVLTLPGQGAKGNGISCRLGDKSTGFERDMYTHYRPRFNSSVTPIHTLDCLLEVVQRNSHVDLLRHIRYSSYIVLGLEATRGIPGLRNKLREIIALTRIARQEGVLIASLIRVYMEVLRKIRNKLVSSNRSKALMPGLRIKFDSNVRNIFDASKGLDAYLNTTGRVTL